ncbi:hypothetical protein B0H13DRAFT_1870437 [Mycena leptocephala]|nr:hypothetical protein B0H13DRAFT_1870437 [Mycena leptocephala]
MFPKLILFAALAGCVLAQGDDTIGSFIAENSTGVIEEALAGGIDFKFLNNITIELISGTAEDKSNNVVDIAGLFPLNAIPVANYSSTDKPTFTYAPHPGLIAVCADTRGFYHGRLNGTVSGSNSIISSLSNTFSINGSSNPLADAAYGPIRLLISSANGSLIFTRSEISGPTGWIEIFWSRIDTLFDLESASTTVEVINNATGFNAGVQTPVGSNSVYERQDECSCAWKMRMNVTTSSPINPGTFSMSSDTFLVVANASQPACPAAAAVNSPSGLAPGNTQPKADSAAGCVLGELSYWIWLPVLFILFEPDTYVFRERLSRQVRHRKRQGSR